MATNVFDVVKEKVLGATCVVVGLSGGVDSMVLAHIVSRIPSIKMVCAHVDHQMRAESVADAEFVQQWCLKMKIQLNQHQLDLCPKGKNFEAWARAERYKFFDKVCNDNNCEWILTAHHADDIVETLLMRLCSNKELRIIEEKNKKSRILRPMLCCTKAELIRYANDNLVPFVEDASNTDRKFLRNKFRHSILPFLRVEIGGFIDAVLLDQAQNVDSDLRYLRERADEYANSLTRYPRHSKEWLRQFRDLLVSLPEVLQWRVAEFLLIEDLGFRVGRRHSQRFVHFVLGEQLGIELPGNVTFQRKNSGLKKKLSNCSPVG